MTPEPSARISLIVIGSVDSAQHHVAATTIVDADDRFEWIRCSTDQAQGRLEAIERTHGAFVGFVDAGDWLHADTFEELIRSTDDPRVDVVYTNEDSVADGIHRDPFLKPAWSPERLIAQNYLGRLTVYRRDLALRAATECADSGKAFEHELALRGTMTADMIVHVDRVLYHRGVPAHSGSTSSTPIAAERVNEILAARSAQYRAAPGPTAGTARLLPHLSDRPLVSIVIPTRGTRRRVRGESMVLVDNCISSIFSQSTYDNYEIICVADADTPATTLTALRGLAPRGVRVVEFAGAFNFADKINLGALHARGSYLLLLNDDVEVTSPSWIEALLAFATDPEVGAVGARLSFEDGRLQHVGVVMSNGGAGHSYYGYPKDVAGYFGIPHVVTNQLAVTAACLMTRRDCFDEVGGLSSIFPINYNDVDYCLKLHHQGYRIVYNPECTLNHYESSSRGFKPISPQEHELIQGRWDSVLRSDPYYSPHFLPGGNYLTEIRADGRPLDEPLGNYRAAVVRRIRAAVRRPRSRN